jgi:hypothetical protein
MEQQVTLSKILENSHVLVSEFSATVPDYVHQNTTVASLWSLLSSGEPDMYLSLAPHDYLVNIVNDFPSMVQTVEAEDLDEDIKYAFGEKKDFDIATAIPVDVTPLLKNVHAWGKDIIDDLCEMIEKKAIRIELIKEHEDDEDFVVSYSMKMH